MSKVFIEESTLTDIADSIRERKSVSTTFKPSKMAAAISNIGDTAETETIVRKLLQRVSQIQSIETSIPTSLSSYAFEGYKNLASVNFQNVKSIGSYAFKDLTKLTSINFPQVTSIGQESFYNCTGLTELNFPKVTSLQANSFEGCTNVKTLSFPALTSWPNNNQLSTSFNTTKISNIAMGFTSIPNQFCLNFSSLSVIDFPKCSKIGNQAFSSCTKLTSITPSIFGTLTSIGSSAFKGCTGLTTVSLRVTTINSAAFANCTSLTKATFSNIQALNGSVFNGCSNLKTLQLKNSSQIVGVTDGDALFTGCHSSLKIEVPQSLVNAYKNNSFWSKYSNKIVALTS